MSYIVQPLIPVRHQNSGAHILVAWIFAVLTLLYFLPWAIAATRHKQNTLTIFLLNLLLGWTGIGWIVALVMSLTSDAPTFVQHHVLHQGPHLPPLTSTGQSFPQPYGYAPGAYGYAPGAYGDPTQQYGYTPPPALSTRPQEPAHPYGSPGSPYSAPSAAEFPALPPANQWPPGAPVEGYRPDGRR